MNKLSIITVFIIIISLTTTSCHSDPEWADPEAHEKTEQLQKQYTPFIVGTWHYKKTIEKQRAFEQLTFNADGTLCGWRKWQSRQVVTIDGQKKYTDWEDVPYENGTFTGTWSLIWERNSSSKGENRIIIIADWDDKGNTYVAYSHNPLFGYADATTLQFAGLWQNSNGWTIYERGESEPDFR